MLRSVIVLAVFGMALAFGAIGAKAAAQDVTSAGLAAQLGQAMSARHLDAIALRDPADSKRYIAAMLFPGVQLLVVAGESPSPAYLDDLIARGKFTEAYTDLQQSALPATKIFFHDMGADGLATNDGADILYEHVTKQTLFNGDWKGQKLKEREYADNLAKAETAYRGLLQPLIAAAGAAAGGVQR